MINPIPELTPLLKQLRLSGMTDSLAMRNREAIEHQLSYPDFLALLVQDEVARRDQKKYVTRLRRAGFRGNKTLESFDLNANPNLNRAYINELADCRFIDEHVAVLLAGPCGTPSPLRRLEPERCRSHPHAHRAGPGQQDTGRNRFGRDGRHSSYPPGQNP